MARFLSRISRGNSSITRLSHGIQPAHVEANGWKGGVHVTFGRQNDDDDVDEFCILASKGSENPTGDYLIARLVVSPNGERTLTVFHPSGNADEFAL